MLKRSRVEVFTQEKILEKFFFWEFQIKLANIALSKIKNAL